MAPAVILGLSHKSAVIAIATRTRRNTSEIGRQKQRMKQAQNSCIVSMAMNATTLETYEMSL